VTAAPTWVLGAGGLLGSHVAGSLRHQGRPVLTSTVPWREPDLARAALRRGMEELREYAGDGAWNVAWCAGAGVIATPESELVAEAELFGAFLDDLGQFGPPGPSGAVFLASSAGGLYAGSPVRAPFTERSAVRPLVAYGRAKVAMEGRLTEFAGQSGAHAFIARIANLYGPGQDLSKQQGLVSQLCLTQITGRPLTVYVPLDTMRDYVFAADVGDLVAAGLAGLRDHAAGQERHGSRVVTKIVASGHCTTIGALISESGRLFKRRARVVVKAPVEGTGQVTDLRLRSVVWPELDAHLTCSLTVGMAKTAADVAQRTRLPRAQGGW
jgi:UDP-glucose 4-epimerase